MIEIRERFDVPADPDRVWAVLSDPHAVVGSVSERGLLRHAMHDPAMLGADIER